MAAAVEKFAGHLVAGEVVHGAQAHTYDILFRVFAQGDAEAHSFHLKGHIDQSLRVAAYVLQVFEFLASEGEDAGSVVLVEFQLFVEHVANDAQSALLARPIDVAINLVLVDTLAQEHADEEVDFGVVGVVGKASRVGHHACVERGGCFCWHIIEGAERINESEHHFAGRTHLGVRNHHFAHGFCAQVVVDDEQFGLCAFHHCRHLLDASQFAEVEAADEVCVTQSLGHALVLEGVEKDLARAWQPCEEIGEGIGHDDSDLFAQVLEICSPSKCGSNGIAIRPIMSANGHALGGAQEGHQL